jgi:serine protease Do
VNEEPVKPVEEAIIIPKDQPILDEMQGDHEYRIQNILTRSIVVISLIAGLLGGAAGSYIFINYFSSSIATSKQKLVVTEDSAVINVAKELNPSVVSINTTSVTPSQTSSIFGLPPSTQQGAGTGMILTSNGLILTNNHVISGSTSVTVVLYNGKQYTGTVVASNASQDYAFVRINATGLAPVKLGDSGSVQIGQRVVAIGNALGQFSNTVTDGIISGEGRPVTATDGSSGSSSESLQDLFQTNAAINPGNSGGPLINLAGQVIGMNTAIAGNAQNIGFSIPINEIKNAISSVESKGVIIRPFLGVRYETITPDLANTNHLSVTNGALVIGDSTTAAVVAGSPADKAGLKNNDIILKVNGTDLSSSKSLTTIISSFKPGDSVSITVLRDGKTITLKTNLTTAPSGS